MSTCQHDLLKSWGVDPDERARLSHLAQGRTESFFGPAAYPRAALDAGAEGRSVAVASIDVTGRVIACATAATSGNEALDQATCDILKHNAHFAPARDLADAPVASHLIVPVRWVLPNL